MSEPIARGVMTVIGSGAATVEVDHAGPASTAVFFEQDDPTPPGCGPSHDDFVLAEMIETGPWIRFAFRWSVQTKRTIIWEIKTP
jgi:hypothetical protein